MYTHIKFEQRCNTSSLGVRIGVPKKFGYSMFHYTISLLFDDMMNPFPKDETRKKHFNLIALD